MELRRYTKILLKWWWLALIAFVVLTTASIVFTYTQPPSYEATVSFIISPTAAVADRGEVRSSLNILDKPTIANTYAEIAQSQTILQWAWNDLGVASDKRWAFKVYSSVLPKTNIMLITVEGPDPDTVYSLADAVTRHTINYVEEMNELFDLKLLDEAKQPTAPFSPNVKLNILLGGILGLGLGVVAALIADYLQMPLEKMEQLSIIDAQTGAYKPSYFLRRLREELSRSLRYKHPLTVSLMRVDNLEEITDLYPPAIRDLVLRQIVHFLRRSLPEENIVALWENGYLALLLPESDEELASKMIERLRNKIAWTLFDIEEMGLKFNFTTSFGLASSDSNGVSPRELLDKAAQSLIQGQNGETDTAPVLSEEV